jgi:3-deoxy-7-phosphoheptulonate synthase
MNTNQCDISTPQIAKAGKLVSRLSTDHQTVVNVNGVKIGEKSIAIIAGPCAVESREQLLATAEFVEKYGGCILRGGAYKPRTSPYSFQGLEEEGLQLLALARLKTNLPVVTEVMDTRKVEQVSQYADMLQVGSRNMSNFSLLTEVGRSKKPVLLKRGMSASIEEFLMAAEYILKEGNDQVVLCERGIRTFETAYRNTLDLNAVAMLKRLTHLPVIVDPSHGTGIRWMVPAMAKAAIVAGADGIIIEVHNDPSTALCDGEQSLSSEEFRLLMEEIKIIAPVIGRSMETRVAVSNIY